MLCKRFKECTRRKWPYRYLRKIDKMIRVLTLNKKEDVLPTGDQEKVQRLKKEKEECMRPVKIRITGSDKLESLNTIDITEYEDNDNDNDTNLEDEEGANDAMASEDENDLHEYSRPITTEEDPKSSASSSDEVQKKDMPTKTATDMHRVVIPSMTQAPPHYATWSSAMVLPFRSAAVPSSFSSPSYSARSQMSIGALVQPSVEHHPKQRLYSIPSTKNGSPNEDLEVAATLNLLRSGTS